MGEPSEPQTLDELTAVEHALVRWLAPLKAINPEVKACMEAARDWAADVSAAEDEATLRDAERRLAGRLEPVAQKWLALSSDYSSAAVEADAAMHALVLRVAAGGLLPEQVADVTESLEGLLMFATVVQQNHQMPEPFGAMLTGDFPLGPDLQRTLTTIVAASRRREADDAVIVQWQRLISGALARPSD